MNFVVCGSAVPETPFQQELRSLSRMAFGNRHKLEVCAAIARSEYLFYVQGISETTGIPTPTIRPIVAGMLGVLLKETPHVGAPTARRYMERVDHPFWEVVITLFDALEADVTAHTVASESSAS
jgi:hypothetical protein